VENNYELHSLAAYNLNKDVIFSIIISRSVGDS
jgi:hypothetical protein